MKGLDAFDELHCVAYGMKKYDEDTIKAEKIIEKELKVLDIIKEKDVDTRYFYVYANLEDYNRNMYVLGRETLTKEEYDLLKEVLK